MVRLRPFQPADLQALYRICLLTGDSGADASPLHSDPHLVGHIYAAPYGVLEPEHVLVVEADGELAGYLVGTHDTAAFEQRLAQQWWPRLQEQYRRADLSALTPIDRMRLASINQPDHAPADLVARFPAHIHMNLLPQLRGQGIGSKLLARWIAEARAANVGGIHLGANSANAAGIAFWTKSGFEPVRTDGRTAWFGMALDR